MPILSLQNVTKDYLSDGQSVRALDGISLEVSEAFFEIFGSETQISIELDDKIPVLALGSVVAVIECLHDAAAGLSKASVPAVNDPDPSSQLYGDGLIAAIAARLFADPREPGADAKGLAPCQLRRVVEYLDAHLAGRVDLAHLAALAGLSQSHFSRAFKASTGMAPYRWQLDARIRRAQALLIDTSASLDDVAEATGFADAVHFGRTFRKLTGATPAAWRHDRKD